MFPSTGRDLMLRFAPNRWWAFVLALAFFVCCIALFSVQAPSTAQALQVTGTDDPVGQAPQPGIGDPDVPITPGQPKPGKAAPYQGGAMQPLNAQGLAPQGEGLSPTSATMMRLRVFWMILRLRLLLY